MRIEKTYEQENVEKYPKQSGFIPYSKSKTSNSIKKRNKYTIKTMGEELWFNFSESEAEITEGK